MKCFLTICTVAVLAAAVPAQTKRALILGIDTYQPAGTTAQHDPGCTYGRCELGSFENLQGAVNDAQSIADVLTSPKFGFPASNVILLTNPAPKQTRSGEVVLPADQTTHDGILAAMKKYLVDVPQPGDTVVFYDASHGSLRVNTAGEKLTVMGDDGKLVYVDSTLVPSDAYKGGYDVRDREMTRIFNAALDKGIHLTVIFDSCHSGGLTRGLTPGRTRSLPYDPRPVNDPPDTAANGRRVPAPAERTDNPALVFSAVQQDQEANEADPSPGNPESHGAFTAALVETLQVLPADASASLVYQRVKAMLEGSGFANQEPDLDAGPARRAQPLFGGAVAADSGKVRTAVLKVNSDSVWLDIGTLSGIGPGSEFTALSTKPGAAPMKVRIDAPLGVARSAASVISAVGAQPQVGDVFELSKLVPAQTAALKFWIGPALPAADIAAAVAQIKASGIATVSDPAEEAYTDILSWNGSAWTLRHAADGNAPASHSIFSFGKKSGPVTLGPLLSSAALKSHLAANAKLWANLPPPRELAGAIKLADPNSSAQPAASIADAGYVLAGSIAKDGARYTWFHKNEYAAVPHPSSDHSPGCSASSPYPVRTDWVATADPSTAAATLNDYSLRLAKVHGWLQLANNASAGASEANYFKLTLLPMTTPNPVDINSAVRENEKYRLALQAGTAVKDPRWVYILDIDCHGKGSLIYPLNYSENQYPSEGDSGNLVVLRHAPTLKVGPPYGVDTMILLSTAQPLPDPSVLNFDGVARGATRGASNPLQQLLSGASSGSRGLSAEVEVPTDWGIETQSLRSVPQGAPGK
ncbi:MAG TPA: caspase family protein [Acidobacteriaceae bacterium]|nr:caspase family protein [Acidobacteriaceae bacterium]